MAEWRARGYVPDSDEEDDSQGSASIRLTPSLDLFNHIDNLEEQREKQVGHEDVRQSKKPYESNAIEDGNVCEQEWDKVAKKQAKKSDLNGANPDSNGAGISQGDPVAPIARKGWNRNHNDDIDELGQDHYGPHCTASSVGNPQEAGPRPKSLDRSITPSPHGPKASSRSSSVLSSIPSSPSTAVAQEQQGLPTVSLAIQSSGAFTDITRTSSIPVGVRKLSVGARKQVHPNCTQTLGGGRSFRQRNPIQLHPYAIESEKYRQSLKARGIKPLHISNTQDNQANLAAEESQTLGADVQEGSQSTLRGSTDCEPPSSAIIMNHLDSLVHTPNEGGQDDEDELPDFASLLRSRPEEFAAIGNKRRKLSRTFTKKRQSLTKTPMPLPSRYTEAAVPVDEDDSMYDIPASPPFSGSSQESGSNASAPKFKVPRRTTPIALPTPLTSSEPRIRPQPRRPDSAESDDDTAFAQDGVQLEVGSNDEDRLADDEPAKELEAVQRRIRGVLPASWLRLDRKMQVAKTQVIHRVDRDPSPEMNDAQRGVARVITGPRKRRPSVGRDLPIVLSGDEDPEKDSDSSESLPELDLRLDVARGTDEDSYGEPLTWGLDRHGEVEEDNRVDAMLPSARRRVFHSNKRSRRNAKHHKPSATAITFPVPHEAQRRHQYQPRITDQLKSKRQKKSRFRAPDLSILDAISPVTGASSGIPVFLKVASRTARLRNDKGRQSPIFKALRLATQADTEDINTTLRNWREGTIQSRSRVVEQSRKPLTPRSGNGELIRAAPHNNKAAAKKPVSVKSSSFTAAKSRQNPPKLQGTFDNILQRGSVQVIETQTRRYKYAHNSSKSREPSNRGQIYSGLRSGADVRPAMLETLQEVPVQGGPEVAFRQDLMRINRLDDIVEGSSSVQASALNQCAPSRPVCSDHSNRDDGGDVERATVLHRKEGKMRHRKQLRPKRVEIECSDYSMPSDSMSLEMPSEKEIPTILASQHSALSGLERFGAQYSSTFDITPFPTGTCFHNSTFIGSGDFHRSTALSQLGDMDQDRGSTSFQLKSNYCVWGQWNDQVSLEFGHAFDEILLFLGNRSDHNYLLSTKYESIMDLQKRIINYVSDHLNFIDPVDRVAFLQRCSSLVTSVWQELAGLDAPTRSTFTMTDESMVDPKILLGTLNLALANQLSEIAEHDLVPGDLSVQVKSLKMKSVRYTLSLVLRDRFAIFNRCLRDPKRLERCEQALEPGHAAIEAFVICCSILSKNCQSLASFWQVANEILPVTNSDTSSTAADVRSLETRWQSLFIVLPFLEFNSLGLLEAGRRFKFQFDNWAPVKQSVSIILEAYMANSVGQSATFNSYCRALFARCFRLISDWNWARCESIIGTIFDFFARNNLAHLRNEECHASPAFLENLAENPLLDISASDRCFHILLKIIAKGLQRMRLVLPVKKVRDIVWRLMPNHGRSHPKEEMIRQKDLDALRNHHDLLCTLYWASPSEFRPRLTVLRNLVHLETSHREACHLNIRAWSYLVHFQLSIREPLTSLQSFADWYDDLLTQTLRQHTQARTEAEEQARSLEYQGGLSISRDLLETTIARNQRQVEAVLGDALVRLQLAIAATKDPEAARMLLTPALVLVFELFDARQPQNNTVIIQALDVVLAYTTHAAPRSKQPGYRDSNDDSQDYGDWSAFAEDDIAPHDEGETSQRALAAAHLRDRVESSLRHLLSNCFGADTPPKEDLMIKVVDVWTTVASLFVGHGMKSWTDYLGPFGQDSWCSLRETQQARKFNAYFLARLIEVNEDIYFDHREHFLRAWIASLVERESMLKFQHRLTSAILNVDAANRLLRNLPFWAGKDTERFEISLNDFSLRRLSLISSVLSNVRESVDNTGCDSSANASVLKQEYKELLKHLMTAMRHNYQELGPTSNTRGAYVDFAHRVVEYLQQHTSSVCPVDRFFTDSSAFPLPVGDPLYVVGQLKNYGLRLQDPRTPKQLAVFLQSVSERAATEGQQQYLVDQLYTAMSNEFEVGDARKPTLRSFLLQAIIPAYIELGFSTPLGWTLLSPFLQALRQTFDELPDVLDGADAASLPAVTCTIDSFLWSLRESFQLLMDDLKFLEKPEMLRLLGQCFHTAASVLPTLDYLIRLRGSVRHSIQCISYLKSFASFTFDTGADCGGSNAGYDYKAEIQPSIAAVRKFAFEELGESLKRYWTQHDGHTYVTRGNTRKEVVIDLKSHEEERNECVAAIRDFLDCLESLPAFGGEEQAFRTLRGRKDIGLEDLLI